MKEVGSMTLIRPLNCQAYSRPPFHQNRVLRPYSSSRLRVLEYLIKRSEYDRSEGRIESHFSRSSFEVEAGRSVGIALSGIDGRLGWAGLGVEAGAGDARAFSVAVAFDFDDAR